ncbi:hypothetical protein PBI_SCTP2_259 [Salicola phage SCTP-2]|nr:hypothetical protein PBI_SCTP2_259 [Salicola phage SCTP-2]
MLDYFSNGDENVLIKMFDIEQVKPRFTKSSLISDVNKNACFCKIEDCETNQYHYQVLQLNEDGLFNGFHSNFYTHDERYRIVSWGRLPQG